MLEFVILMIIIDILCKIKFSDPTADAVEDADNQERASEGYNFKSLDDCMEYRELRATGWRGNADDFYKWKEEE